MGFYLPLVVNDRYLGGFVLVLFLVLLRAVRFRTEDEGVVRIVVVATFFMMALATAGYTIRVVNHSIPVGEGPSSTEEDLRVAERLRDFGMTPGTKVAVIGDGDGAYWARLAHLRIVAEIMDRNGGSAQFWRSAESVQQHVYDLFHGAHAKLAVASCVSSCPARPKGWKEIPGTSYCVHNLDTQGFPSSHLP
jgi:Fe2+ transport system protein FeoA